jgi:hypothetical protein
MSGILRRLRPTEREVHELAVRETDPRFYARFAPITRGRTFAVFAILALGLVAVALTPFWVLRPRRQRP